MAKKQEEKIDIFGSAKVKIKGSKPKDNKEVVYVDGLEPKLLELEFLKAQIEDLKSQLNGVADEIKNISKEKFVELYKSKKSNPNTFLIKDGEGCVMVIPTDKYTSIKDEDRVNELIDEYGDDIITTDGQWVFNTEVLERNIDAIKQLLMDAKTISNEDKKNLLVNEKSYSISKGYIDKLAQYGSKIGTVVDDIQPIIALKNCGGKMEEGGMMGDDFIGNIYDDDTELYYTKDYFEYADWNGDGDNNGYIYGINLLDENGDVMDAEWFKSDSERRNYILENNLFEYKFEGGGFLGGIFGGGRTYKKGLAYKLDRAKHNKSEDWEVPMKNRKKRYEDGDMVDDNGGGFYQDWEDVIYKDKRYKDWMSKLDKKTNKVIGEKNVVYLPYQDVFRVYKYSNGGGVEQVMTDEMCVIQSCVNGEIHCDMLEEIIGSKPNYPYQQVGSIRLEKCYLRPYYKIS